MSVPLSGRVTDFATNAGVPGATIEFGYLDLFGRFVAAAKAVSDGTGSYRAGYGTVADALTLRPVSGATVTLQGTTALSGPNGWYRIDLGCPSSGVVGFNTTFLQASHPDYPSRSFIAGRGVSGVSRMDLSLQKRAFPVAATR